MFEDVSELWRMRDDSKVFKFVNMTMYQKKKQNFRSNSNEKKKRTGLVLC